ncbi:MAG: hypothetical protein ACRDNF_13095 [Streptosporangiaceae bacterium]
MLNVLPVVMLVAAAAVLIGVIVVAMGRGGELAFFQADYAPLKLEQVAATDVALFRPPTALWGYSMPVTDEALGRIAAAITERDVEIAALRQQVADLEASRAETGPRDEPAPRDDQVASAQEPPPAARSVWEPAQQPMQGSGEAGDTAQWAALPRRMPAPGARAAGDEDER